MSDDGYVNGELVPSPTTNAYVVGVEIVPPAPPDSGGGGATAPTISSLSPASAEPGTNFVLSLLGTGFTSDVVVWFDGAAVNTGFVDAGRVDTAVNGSSYTADADVPVWVVDTAGQSNTVTFQFIEVTP